MNSMNQFIVIGRLVKDPELKTLENGSRVTNITVATEREYLDKEGKPIVDFLNFALWDKNADKICEMSKGGALIRLEGYNTTKEIEVGEEKRRVFNPVVTKYRHLVNAKNYSTEPIETEQTAEMEK